MFKYIPIFLLCLLTTEAHSGKIIEQSGIASHYGKGDRLHGTKTANGERFNRNDLTAAHRRLPFGTRVKVTHKNKFVIVRINDRGPFVRGRIIDLSYAAAKIIGCTGLCRVNIQVQ